MVHACLLTSSGIVLLLAHPRFRFSLLRKPFDNARAVLWDLFYVYATSGLGMSGNNKSGTHYQSFGKVMKHIR